MVYDYVAWLVFAGAALLVGIVAAVEVALTAVDRPQIHRRRDEGDSRAALVEEMLQDSAQFWLTSMLVKTIGLLSAGVAVGREFTASAPIGTVVLATILAWLALGAAQIIGRSLAVGSAEQVALRLAPLARALVHGLVTLYLYALPGRRTPERRGRRGATMTPSSSARTACAASCRWTKKARRLPKASER